MRLATSVGREGGAGAIAKRARELDQLGVDYLWTGEAYTADGVSMMGFLAAVTERAQIGSSILPLFTRTPTLLAMTAVGVDSLSNGRCILGLGASGPQVIEGFHGVPYDHPVQRTREIIEICRSVWRRDALTFNGECYQVPLPPGEGTGLGKPLKLIDHPLRERIPIYVASLGPKNVEVTAELAEGWFPLHFWPEKFADVWGDAIAAGSKIRAPELGPLDVVAGGHLAIGDDVEHLRGRSRRALALYFGGMGARRQNFYNELLRRYGYEQIADDVQEAYLSGRKKEAAAMIPDALVDGTSLVGSAGWLRERIEAFRDAGVTVLNVEPVGPDPSADLALVRDWLA
jgi:F420-dependent oxidoreductase-like protein